MTRVVGLLSSVAESYDLDLFVNARHTTPPTETVELKDGYLLDIVDVPVRNMAYVEKAVGYASLHPGLVAGEYEGYYGLNAHLRGKGIVSNAMRAVVRRAIEQDEQFSAANFLIAPRNESSIHVAQSLGAEPRRQVGVFQKFVLTAEQFMAKQAQEANHGQ